MEAVAGVRSKRSRVKKDENVKAPEKRLGNNAKKRGKLSEEADEVVRPHAAPKSKKRREQRQKEGRDASRFRIDSSDNGKYLADINRALFHESEVCCQLMYGRIASLF